jgi:hypothetical protein
LLQNGARIMSTISLATWILLVDGLTIQSPAPVNATATAEAAKVENAPARVQEPPPRREFRANVALVPVRVDARNMMGRRFRLIEARFVLGGVEVARLTAAPGQEIDLSARPIQALLGRGEHALTAVFVYQGRNLGLFSYLGNYRYRLEQTYSFYLEPGQSTDPAIQVIARERGGVMVPLEKRPSMEIASAPGVGLTPMTGVTHGTEVTVVR